MFCVDEVTQGSGWWHMAFFSGPVGSPFPRSCGVFVVGSGWKQSLLCVARALVSRSSVKQECSARQNVNYV